MYQIIIEYDGTNYVGWQSQLNGKSIQNEIEKILSKILKENVRIHGSGRTDAGVHASNQSAHFDIKNNTCLWGIYRDLSIKSNIIRFYTNSFYSC